MEAALIQELHWRGSGNSNTVSTVYFGGGTPSLFPVSGLKRMLDAMGNLSETMEEVTLEANPEDITQEKLDAWLEMGITRLSIGVQSFDDTILNWMNRAHTGDSAETAIRMASNAGFQHITGDLIYGLPDRSAKDWETDLNRMLDLPIDHLSAYILTIEPKTALGHRVKIGKQRVAEEEAIANAYHVLCNRALAAGFDHYEVSNFARAGGHALHNQNYWKGVPFWGVGPGAHGFDGENRYAHVSNNRAYVKAINEAHSMGDVPLEIDPLTVSNRYNERIMTGLRMMEGIDPEKLQSEFGRDPRIADMAAWTTALQTGDLIPLHNGKFRIPEDHWLFADAIASEFFWVDH
jgi:oxygen-independent coproporphyrinogen-3 oxidase